MCREGSDAGALRPIGFGVLKKDGDEVSVLSVTTEEKRNVNVNMKQHSNQRPVVGGIYHDKSRNSLLVLNVVGDKVLLEYANGTITTADASSWQQLEPQIAVC